MTETTWMPNCAGSPKNSPLAPSGLTAVEANRPVRIAPVAPPTPFPKPGDVCVPGTQRWCDGLSFCGWGMITCLPDGSWPTTVKNGKVMLDCQERADGKRPNTRAILIETVSNPTLRVADVAGIAVLARERGILLLVDSTFSTPRAVRALELGADIVIQSVTKLLAGHADATLGYVAAQDPAQMLAIRTLAVMEILA